MSPIAKRGLLLSGGFLVVVAATASAFVTFDGASARGIGLGLALGVVNLVAGLLVMRRSLHHGGMRSATATLAGGFGARLVVLVTLFMIFRHSSTIDASAFGLTFVALFFVYLAVEIVMVERYRTVEHA